MLGKQKVDLGSGVSSNIREILNNALNGGEVSLAEGEALFNACLLYTSPSPRDGLLSRMPSSA